MNAMNEGNPKNAGIFAGVLEGVPGLRVIP